MKGNNSMNHVKIYKLKNKMNGAEVTSTEKFLVQWFARGFELIEIEDEQVPNKLSKFNK